MQPPTNEEVTKEVQEFTDCTKAVLVNFKPGLSAGQKFPGSAIKQSASAPAASWYQGQIQIITCDDERLIQIYRAAVVKVGQVNTGAQLVAD